MHDATRTTTVLLDGLRDPANSAAWEEFDRRYRPIVLGLARRLGLDDADAADVAQETMARFLSEYQAGRYDRARGRLRSWMAALARTRVADLRRKRASRREDGGESAVASLPDEAALSALWEAERRSAMLREALERLRHGTRTSDRTIEVFELLTVSDMPAAAVAQRLSMEVQEVYVAKSRVAQRLRSILGELEAAYEEG